MPIQAITRREVNTMEKRIALQRWHDLPENQEILPHFTPIAADAKGSTFGACGIRISGNPAFIDAVLSRLKDILAAEAGATRLSLSRQSVKPVAIRNGETETVKQWGNADTDAETCYIQIRERTAKTRQRKAREATAPLFADKNGEIPSSIPAVLPDTFSEPTPAVKPHNPPRPKWHDDRVVAHIGNLPTGEVIWDDDEETQTA